MPECTWVEATVKKLNSTPWFMHAKSGDRTKSPLRKVGVNWRHWPRAFAVYGPVYVLDRLLACRPLCSDARKLNCRSKSTRKTRILCCRSAMTEATSCRQFATVLSESEFIAASTYCLILVMSAFNSPPCS